MAIDLVCLMDIYGIRSLVVCCSLFSQYIELSAYYQIAGCSVNNWQKMCHSKIGCLLVSHDIFLLPMTTCIYYLFLLSFYWLSLKE